MVQKYGRELSAEIPEVDAFVGLDELENAPAAALGLPTLPRFTDKPLATRLYDELAPRVLSRRRGYAYLKVGEGCDNPCTFCTIPQMRGLQRSRTVASLVAEARSLEAQGVSELVLISQDTTRYGEDLGLGRGGSRAPRRGARRARRRFPWIRFLYAYPKTLDDSVLDLMAREPRFLPVRRHPAPARLAADPLRDAPRRRLGVLPADDRADARARVPAIAIRTTFIVGFPGEGEAEFAELLRVRAGGRASTTSGVFTYSPEPGSGSEPLGDPVPAEEKERRKDFLLSLQQPIARGKLRALRGTRPSRRSSRARRRSTSTCSTAVCARRRPRSTGRLLITDAGGRTLFPGEIVRVRIEKTFDYDVTGSVVGRP